MNALLEEIRVTKALPSPSDAQAIRVAAGVSKARLALELGVCPMTIARWEAGSYRPTARKRRAYVEILAALKDAAAG